MANNDQDLSPDAIHHKEIYEWMGKMLTFEYEQAIREASQNFQELFRRIEEHEHMVITKLEEGKKGALQNIKRIYERIVRFDKTKLTMNKEESKKLTDKEIDKSIENLTHWSITKLTWDMDEIDTFLEKLCEIEDHDKYTDTYWSKVTRGADEHEIETPRGIAIDPINNFLYIVDSGDYTDRIQVFDDFGEHMRTLEGNGEMAAPYGIYIYENYIYITCMDSPMVNHQTCIMKMDKLNGNVLAQKDTMDPIYHPFVDSEDDTNIRIYGCGMYEHRLHVFDEDLETLAGSPIYLQTIGNKSEDAELEDRTKVMSVKVFNQKVFLLLALTMYAVQLFDMKGAMTQTLINDTNLIEPFAFCFDIFNNIIIVDRQQNRVCLYSSVTGNFLREIGEGSGTDIGEFVGPKGIVLGRQQQFVVLDSKDIFTLQAF